MRILYKIYIYLSIPLLWTLRLLELLSTALLKALSLPHMNPEYSTILWPSSQNHSRHSYDETTPVLDSSTGKFNIFAAFAAVVAASIIFLSRKYTATIASSEHHIAQYKNLRRSGQRAAFYFSLKIAELNNTVRTQISQIQRVRAHIFTMQQELAVQKRANEGLQSLLRGAQDRFRISERAAQDESAKHLARQEELLKEVNAGKDKIAELEEILRVQAEVAEEHAQVLAALKEHHHETELELENTLEDIAKRDEYIEALEEEFTTKTRTTFRERVDDRAEMGDLRREIETLNRDLKDVRQRSESFQQERDTLRTQLEDAEAKFATLKVEHAELKEKLEDDRAEMGDLRREIETLNRDLKDVRQRSEPFQQERDTLRTQLEDAEAKFATLKGEHAELKEKLEDLVEFQETQESSLRQENAQLAKDIKAFHKQVSSTLLVHAERSLDFGNAIEQPAQPAALERDVTMQDDAELRKMFEALQDDLARTGPPPDKVEASADLVVAEEANGEEEGDGYGSSGEGVAMETCVACVADVELPKSDGKSDEDKSMPGSGPTQESLPPTGVPMPVISPSPAAAQVAAVVEPTQDVSIASDDQEPSPATVKEEKPKSFRDAVAQHSSPEEQSQIPGAPGVRGKGRDTIGAQFHNKSSGARTVGRSYSSSTHAGGRVTGHSSLQPNWRQSMAPRAG